MATVIRINGVVADLPALRAWPERLDLRKGAISTLTIARRGGPLPPVPDALMGVEVQVEIDEAIVFTGDVLDQQVDFTADVGWVTSYQARCLRNRGDQAPFIDSNTLTTTALYNLPIDDEAYFPSRSGRTVGEVIQDCLEMQTTADALDAMGIGAYVSLSPPTLPAATLADLAALDQIPPQPAAVSGGKCLSAIDSYLQSTTPNAALHVEPDGAIRFLDQRDVTELVLTLGDCGDRVSPPSVRRSIADCCTQVEIMGMPKAEPKWLSLSNGGLAEDFDDASGYDPDWFLQDRESRSFGTCSVDDTLNVTIDPADASQAWGSDEFDQSHQMGTLYLWANVIAGVDSVVTRKVVSHPALTAGGTCKMTLDSPLPASGYTNFALYGVSQGKGLMYRRYKVTDPDIAAALARKFSQDATWVNADGSAGAATLFPMASVCWNYGAPPDNEVTDDFTIDPENGTITFIRPTYITAGNRVPSDVRFLAAVNTGVLSAVAPASGYEGTAYTVDGVERRLRLFQKNWTDPGNQAPQEAYAQEVLDSIKDTVVDLSVTVNKLVPDAMAFGRGLSIDGAGYTTGLESANLPINAVTLTWNSGSASHHTTTITASNRRTAMSPDNLLPPERERRGYGWGRDVSGSSRGNLDQYSPEAWAQRSETAGGGER